MYSQDISGEWIGEGFQPGSPVPNSKIILNLTQVGNKITGTKKTIVLNNENYYCLYSFSGTFDGKILKFNEGNSIDEANDGTFSCCRGVEYKLNLEVGKQQKLEGTGSAPNCNPTTLKVRRDNSPSNVPASNCVDYISPVFVSKENILEINSTAQLAGFPDANYPYASNSNGCGPADDWKWILVPGGFFGLADFTSTCDCHDKCYLTSDNRNLCDTKFYNALVDVCNSSEHVNKQNCIRAAELFRNAVREGGTKPHQQARILQKKYESWLMELVHHPSKQKIEINSEAPTLGIVKTKQRSNLNLRSKPSDKASIITKIPNDSQVSILGYDDKMVIVNGETGMWCNIEFKDTIGWAWGKFIIPNSTIEVVKNDFTGLPDKIADIPVKYQKTINVKSREVTIYPFDNEKEDGDIVSININGVWVRDHFTLKLKKASPNQVDLIKCSLNPGDYNYIISRAWNVGSIAPNTLTIKIDDGVSVQEVLINSDVGLSGGIRIVCNK